MSQIVRQNLEKIQASWVVALNEFHTIQGELGHVSSRLAMVEERYQSLFPSLLADEVPISTSSRRGEARMLDEQRFELMAMRQRLTGELSQSQTRLQELHRRRDFFLGQAKSLVEILQEDGGNEHLAAVSYLSDILMAHEQKSIESVSTPARVSTTASDRSNRNPSTSSNRFLRKAWLSLDRKEVDQASRFLQETIESGGYVAHRISGSMSEGLARDRSKLVHDGEELSTDQYIAAVKLIAEHDPVLALELSDAVSHLSLSGSLSTRNRTLSQIRRMVLEALSRVSIGVPTEPKTSPEIRRTKGTAE